MSLPLLNATHDPARRSFVESANDGQTDFPIQNLPFGIFRRAPNEDFRVGVAIGDQVLAIAPVVQALGGDGRAGAACEEGQLNGLMALGPDHWSALRHRLSDALCDAASDTTRALVSRHLSPAADCELAMPVAVGGFTDFYASIHHATNAGKLIRPDNPLLPNYKHIPVGYHGRVSTIRTSGASVRRPNGQVMPPGAIAPELRPSARLDYEAELGIYLGMSSDMGVPIPIGDAGRHIFGFCLLNDWSARDIQVWEYQPLGPFLAKNFATIVSPWVVTEEAMRPYRVPAFARSGEDPAPLPHLWDTADQQWGGFAMTIEACLLSAEMRARGLPPYVLGRGAVAELYWTVAQMVAHHSSNGCAMMVGDLIGSGTVSGPEPDQWGSLLELTWGGTKPIELPSGETRTFVADDDQIILRGACEAPGRARIGFGECRTTIAPAPIL